MNDIFNDFEDADDEPFAPVHNTQPAKKRGRPASTAKPKAAAKPKFSVPRFGKERLVEALMEVAEELTPTTATHADKLRVAADLLELIEKAKA